MSLSAAMGLTPKQRAAWKESAAGVVVDMKRLTGENIGRPRMDIDVFMVKHPDTFNLMLQAMIAMQDDPSAVGYFQVAGIHGWPRNGWNFVPQTGWEPSSQSTWEHNPKTYKDRFGGYCAHGVHVFGPWHRPYLSLMEQTLWRHMYTIAESYTDPDTSERYLDAVKEFRLPYFDYFRPRGGEVTFPGVRDGKTTTSPYDFRLPDIFMEEKVTLNLAPDNHPDSVWNPLYTYSFQHRRAGQLKHKDKTDFARLGYNVDNTVRCPEKRSDIAHSARRISNRLNQNREDRCAMLLSLVKDKIYSKWTTIASDAKLTRGDFTHKTREMVRGGGSLEDIHNAYHGHIGGDGAMGHPGFAAFDPVFWFHHCNIDRYFALWQGANPDEWFPEPDPTDPDAVKESQKNLLPFFKVRAKGDDKGRVATDADTKYWNSDDVRSTSALGYYYDDFNKIVDREGDKPGDGVRRYVTEKYRWAARVPNDPTIRPPPEDMKPINDKVRALHFFKDPHWAPDVEFPESGLMFSNSVSLAPLVPVTQKIDPAFDREWYVDSEVQRAAANGPFTIFFFLALPENTIADHPSKYASSPYLAGTHKIFASLREGCDNCAQAEAAGKLSVSTTPITSLLLQYRDLQDNELESLRPEHVKPFLEKYLRWRVLFQGSSEPKDPRQVPDLVVGVSAKVYHDDGEPTYEDYPEVVEAIKSKASAVPDSAV
ncbi:hypothetical protein QBC35DRAFT_186135 [Podospora australis]|uniref:tyrosinase n=1 Tax=Podospora australis TaxID=1536484 RepID=A0AAN7ADW1_9PEZI|nr:hypothetical protein QBC35DRAFT_186135 [Podospora australis]